MEKSRHYRPKIKSCEKCGLVTTLFKGPVAQGSHQANFNAENLARGVYFYRVITEHELITRQMTFLR